MNDIQCFGRKESRTMLIHITELFTAPQIKNKWTEAGLRKKMSSLKAKTKSNSLWQLASLKLLVPMFGFLYEAFEWEEVKQRILLAKKACFSARHCHRLKSHIFKTHHRGSRWGMINQNAIFAAEVRTKFADSTSKRPNPYVIIETVLWVSCSFIQGYSIW